MGSRAHGTGIDILIPLCSGVFLNELVHASLIIPFGSGVPVPLTLPLLSQVGLNRKDDARLDAFDGMPPRTAKMMDERCRINHHTVLTCRVT